MMDNENREFDVFWQLIDKISENFDVKYYKRDKVGYKKRVKDVRYVYCSLLIIFSRVEITEEEKLTRKNLPKDEYLNKMARNIED